MKETRQIRETKRLVRVRGRRKETDEKMQFKTTCAVS